MVYYNEYGSITSNAAPRTLTGDSAIIAALAAEITRLTAERDEARAQVAMAYSRCLTLLRDVGLAGDHDNDPLSVMLREQCPPDATAALAARDAAMRNEGRRQAAIICNMSYGDGLRAAHAAILAALESEGGE